VIYVEAGDEKAILVCFETVCGMPGSAPWPPRSRNSLTCPVPSKKAINSPLACSAFAS